MSKRYKYALLLVLLFFTACSVLLRQNRIPVNVNGELSPIRYEIKPLSRYTKTRASNKQLQHGIDIDSCTHLIIDTDIDLEGRTFVVPRNCVLEFKGGQFYNGKVFSDKQTTVVINPPKIIDGVNDTIYWGSFFDIEGYELTYRFDRIERNFEFYYPVLNQRRFCGRRMGSNKMNLYLDAIPNRRDLTCDYGNYKAPLHRPSTFESVMNQIRRYNSTMPMLRFTINVMYSDQPDKNPKHDLLSTYSDEGYELLKEYVRVTKFEIDKYEKVRDELQLEYIGVINEQEKMMDVPEYYALMVDLSNYIREKHFKSLLSNSLPSSGVDNGIFNFDDFDVITINYYPDLGHYKYGDNLPTGDKMSDKLTRENIKVFDRIMGKPYLDNKKAPIYVSECGVLPYYENLHFSWEGVKEGRKIDSGHTVLSCFYENSLNLIKSLGHPIYVFTPWFATEYNDDQIDWMYDYFLKLKL